MAGPKKVSQMQLAKELGVSQALVSLVLNGRRQGINPKTYERIWAHAVKRGYHPKGMHLVLSPTPLTQVAVIFRAPLRLQTSGGYFGHVQRGLHAALEARGFTSVFLGAEDELTVSRLRRTFSLGHPFRGIIVLGEVSRSFFDLLRELDLRIVVASACYPGLCDSVRADDRHALESLVQHLTVFGHRRIGWLGGNKGLGRHEVRFNSFKAALDRAGLSSNPRYCVAFAQGDRAEGIEAAHAVLAHAARKDFPTAFVCYNGLMADGVMKTFARAKLRVPADISIVSADAAPAATESTPRVTSAGTCPQELGEAAARLLLESSEGEDKFTDLILPAKFFAGDTTGPVGRK